MGWLGIGSSIRKGRSVRAVRERERGDEGRKAKMDEWMDGWMTR